VPGHVFVLLDQVLVSPFDDRVQPDGGIVRPDAVLGFPDAVLVSPDAVLGFPDAVLSSLDAVLSSLDAVLSSLDAVLSSPDGGFHACPQPRGPSAGLLVRSTALQRPRPRPAGPLSFYMGDARRVFLLPIKVGSHEACPCARASAPAAGAA
jgi:hypothetical protein